MKVIDGRSCLTCLTVVLLCVASTVTAEERDSERANRRHKEAQLESWLQTRKPRRWNVGFVYGSTTFVGSEAHRTVGATFRIRLTNRLSVESELSYLSLPDRSYEWARGRTVSKHSDIVVGGHLIYDFRDEREARVIPYVAGGARWIQTRDESTTTWISVESPIPVFPTPSSPQSRSYKDAINWMCLRGAFGIRILLPEGFFVSPEVNLGGSWYGDLTAGAVIKLGYGF
jgi:hypothetical protein